MKTLLLTIALLLSILQNCFAAYDVITAEQESEKAVSYILAGEGRTPLTRKYFVKYITDKNESEYWIRISTVKTDRFMPYIDIEIDDKTYRVYAFEEHKKRHLHAGESTKLEYHSDHTFEIYPLSINLIEEMVKSKKCTITAPTRKREGMILTSNEYWINGIKEIMNLRYEDREPYFTNKEKVKISNK